MTVKELFDLYMARHVLLRNKSLKNPRSFWRVYGLHWGSKEVEGIKTVQAQDWFDDAAIRSRSSAVRALDTLRALFNWGIRRGYIIGNNPFRTVERLSISERERFLLPEEFARFQAALTHESRVIQDFISLCLLTGARRGNVLSMQWSEIDLSLGMWRIPGEKHKNGHSHIIPLTAPAIELLSRRKSASKCDFVFPGRGKEGFLGEPRRAWKRVLKRSQIKDLRMHDLRRTVGSYLAIKGESTIMIGKVLGHRDSRSTAIYARLDLTPVRLALESMQTAFNLSPTVFN